MEKIIILSLAELDAMDAKALAALYMKLQEAHSALVIVHEGCDKEKEASKLLIEQLGNSVETLEKKLEASEEELERLRDIVATAGAENELSGNFREVEHKGKTYLVKKNITQFRLAGSHEQFSIADLKKDELLVARVLSIEGQTILEEKQ